GPEAYQRLFVSFGVGEFLAFGEQAVGFFQCVGHDVALLPIAASVAPLGLNSLIVTDTRGSRPGLLTDAPSGLPIPAARITHVAPGWGRGRRVASPRGRRRG